VHVCLKKCEVETLHEYDHMEVMCASHGWPTPEMGMQRKGGLKCFVTWGWVAEGTFNTFYPLECRGCW
jgi:hypothetical protein